MNWILMMSYVGLFISPIIFWSSESWFLLWFSLEINLITFSFIIMNNMSNFSTNGAMKYFIIQSFASSLFIFSIILNKIFLISDFYSFIIIISMIIKLGLSPFHFWLTDVGESLSMNNFIIFNTWQKIIPLTILSNYPFYLSWLILFSSLTGMMMMFNQNSIRKILIFSSLIHMSWMLILMPFHSWYWFIYFLFYTISLIGFNYYKKWINSMFNSSLINNWWMKIIFFSLFINLSALPPLMGFMPKMIFILNNNLTLMILFSICLVASFISCYIYIRYSFPNFNFFIFQKFIYMNNSYSMIFMNMLFFSLFLLIFFI